MIGAIAAIGGLGMVGGALAASRVTRRFGLGRAVVLGLLLLGLSDAALPLAGGPTLVVVAILAVGQVGFGVGLTVFNIGQVSLRQQTTSDQMQGRTNATFRVALAGSIPLGALAGGFAGELFGLRSVLFVAVGGEIAAGLLLLTSAVGRNATVPNREARGNEC